jgi:hypothetical protein
MLLTDWAGVHDANSMGYLWWSGIGSVFVPPLLTVLGLTVVAWWHHNCHEPRCFRWGRFEDSSDPVHTWRKCRKHHPRDVPGVSQPDDPLTLDGGQ